MFRESPFILSLFPFCSSMLFISFSSAVGTALVFPLEAVGLPGLLFPLLSELVLKASGSSR